jgi:hypothetical protein
MRSFISARSMTGLGFLLTAGALSAQTVKVVNMTPASLSSETRCDAEPSIAVNPANVLQMAGTAFTPNPAGGTMAPYYVSTDGGNTWSLNAVIPGGTATSDVSLRFGSTSNILYAGILRQDNTNLNILRTTNFASTTPMTILVDRGNEDQPFLDARTVSGTDRVYIGNNDFNQSGGKTATVDLSVNAGTGSAPAGFAPAGVEKRTTASQDGPSVRCASAPDGRVYGAFLGWRSGSSTFVSDVVVVRDDAGGSGSTKFGSLVGSDGLAGVKAATGQNMTFNSTLGSNRAGSSLSIAVDPTDSLTVYVAWGEDGSGGGWTLHLRRSTDGGVTWSGDLRTIVGATNPAIAINSNGTVGFFYQKLVSGKWSNQADFAPKNDPFTSPTTIVLATLPDNSTGTCGQPTIGDYSGMMAVGTDFYGVFSGSNAPITANFPHGVTFQRNANWSTGQLLSSSGSTVSTSIDPYFFQISGVGGPQAPAITSQPVSQSVATGSTATFTVGASGTAPLSYQWFKNSAAISGATASSYTTPATTASDNGSTFYVTVTNSAGSVTSATATLTVSSPVAPTITTQPSNVTVNAGQTASFSVTATGTSPLSYQWRKNGTNISGATAASYTTPATVIGDSGSTFSVVVSNSVGGATSNNATLTVNQIIGNLTETEPNDTIATANSVPSTVTSITGNLTVSTDVDYYAVTLAAGEKITVNMSGPSGPDWDLYLVNASGGTLTSSTGSTTTESMTYTNSGSSSLTVYIKVIVYSGTSSSPYTLAISRTTPPPPAIYNEVEPNNSVSAANVVADNITKITGYISSSTDNDYFKLNVGAGKTLTLAMTGPTGSTYDYDLYLYDATGATQLAASEGSTTTENISWKNTGASTVSVIVAVKRYAGSSTTIPYNVAITR